MRLDEITPAVWLDYRSWRANSGAAVKAKSVYQRSDEIVGPRAVRNRSRCCGSSCFECRALGTAQTEPAEQQLRVSEPRSVERRTSLRGEDALNLLELPVTPPFDRSSLWRLIEVDAEAIASDYATAACDRYLSCERYSVTEEIRRGDRAMEHTRHAISQRGLLGDARNLRLREPASWKLLPEIRESLDQEHRRDAACEELIEPDRLVHGQRLQERLVEDERGPHGAMLAADSA